ncbi:MAG: malonyl-ACP O-methyltransferase BioC [Pseudomonadota bacterium]
MQEFELDKARVRRAFDTASRTYDSHAQLQGMVREEMLERLAWMRLRPSLVLDLGCGTGRALGVLRERYRQARIVGMDLSSGMLSEAAEHRPWLRKPMLVCGDMERMPLPGASVDLLFSSLALQWSCAPERVFSEVRRVLKPDGLFMFSTLGPGSLQELRDAWSVADPAHSHVNMFFDMHDLGDALLRAGLRDPVMDVDRLSFGFEDVGTIMRGLKGIGARNGMEGRARGLTGKGRLARMREAYEALRDEGGALPVSYEVIHGMAWGGESGRYRVDARGEVRIPLSSLKR